jgi:hypothetical protein
MKRDGLERRRYRYRSNEEYLALFSPPAGQSQEACRLDSWEEALGGAAPALRAVGVRHTMFVIISSERMDASSDMVADVGGHF